MWCPILAKFLLEAFWGSPIWFSAKLSLSLPSLASTLRTAFLRKPSNSVFHTELWLWPLAALRLLF